MSYIGIKLANHDFFPILEEKDGIAVEKDLELTTIRNNQESVQINLFKQSDETDPEYIGSLIIEDIAPQPKGEATISLKLKLDKDKNLSAEAVDLNSGTKQALELSLKNFEADNFEALDFDLTEDGNFENLDFAEEDALNESFEEIKKTGTEEVPNFESAVYPAGIYKAEKNGKKAFPIWLTVFLIILGVGLLVLAILLLTNVMRGTKKIPAEPVIIEQPVPAEPVKEKDKDLHVMDELTKEPPKPAEEPEREKPAEDAASVTEKEKPAEEKEEPEKKETSNIAVTHTGAVRYKIKWGDTLWDLSETYYKNPWLYKKIARHNKIKNPNLIISGTYIEIPPK